MKYEKCACQLRKTDAFGSGGTSAIALLICSLRADGTGSVSYQDALAAIFIEGWIIILSVREPASTSSSCSPVPWPCP